MSKLAKNMQILIESVCINVPGDLGAKLAILAQKHYKPNTVNPIIVDQIYDAYPRKVGVKAAKLAIRKACKEDDPIKVLNKTKLWAKACEKKEKKYIPYPATWYNQGRYLDDDVGINEFEVGAPKKLGVLEICRIRVIEGELNAMESYETSDRVATRRQQLREEKSEILNQ